jgi:integrase
MTKRLTEVAVRNLKPSAERREISDHANGLFLVLQPSGRRSWAVRYRYGGQPIKLTLGTWPALSLAAARKAAADAALELAEGRNPAKAKENAKARAAEARQNTVAAICAEYLKREGKKLRTADQRVSILRRLVYPALGEMPINEVKRSDVIRMLDAVEDKVGERAADVTLAVLRRIFHWHALRSDEFRSPIVRGMARQNPKEHARDRILDDDELRRVWTAATQEGPPFGSLVKFLLLTSARRGEAAGMRWEEVDEQGLWVLPAARSKTKTEITRPLSKAAHAIITEQPNLGPWVFSSIGRGPLVSFATFKKRLDATSGVADWRLHDLRRTARSLLSRAGINSDIAERCIGHAIPGVRGVYDRHDFVIEMRHAFEALAALIDRIVNPPAGERVVPLRRGA